MSGGIFCGLVVLPRPLAVAGALSIIARAERVMPPRAPVTAIQGKEAMAGETQETPEHRLKRLGIRSWRRGTKEMDIILGQFSDARLAALSSEALDAYEAILAENDQDLYRWVSGQDPLPQEHAPILEEIREFHKISCA
jgi:antitoxin CptB